MSRSKLPEPFEETFHRRRHSHVSGHGLHDNCADLAGMPLEVFTDGFEIVVTGDESVV